jgi:hydroxylysine kinase
MHVDPIFESFESPWRMDRMAPDHERIQYIETDELRDHTKRIFAEFQRTVMEKTTFQSLRKGIIHGDLNNENILVDQKVNPNSPSGFIDFGDMSYAPFIFELAICALYALESVLNKASYKTGSEVEVTGHVVSGYLSLVKLTETEIGLLLTCIKTRICQSIMNSSFNNHFNPGNLYALKSQQCFKHLLTVFQSIESEEIYTIWRKTFSVYSEQGTATPGSFSHG